MTQAEILVKQLQASQKRFQTAISTFSADDASFAPRPGMYTVAGHIAHAADSIEWFIEGAFGTGWDMDFEKMSSAARAVTTLEEATAWLDRAFTRAIETVRTATPEELAASIADTRIMGGASRWAVVDGVVEHTAHHRGSLVVYSRLLGKAPPMVYS